MGLIRAFHTVRRSAEISLYVHKDMRGMKIGEKALARIVEEAKKQGDRFHTIIGR